MGGADGADAGFGDEAVERRHEEGISRFGPGFASPPAADYL
jgi:hypothetical protein